MKMAGEDNITSYSCEGTLLIPTGHGQVGGWRERLVSGNRLTIILMVVGKRWSSDSRFLLWGENYRQEKVFEVNLRYVGGYFIRTKTWHEIVASDRRHFALSFHDSNQFARFYEELESTLSFLKKLKKTTTDDAAGSIAVLRVDKLPPPKPARAFQHPPSRPGIHTPPSDEHTTSDCFRQLQCPEAGSRSAMDSSPERKESAADVAPEEEQTTKWHVNIYDDAPTTPPDSKHSDDISGIYETIADPVSVLPNPSDDNAHEDTEDAYDNVNGIVNGVHDSRPHVTKPKEVNACSNLLYDMNTTFLQNSVPTPRKVMENHVYDDRRKPMESDLYRDSGSYDNIKPISTKPKPRLPIQLNEPTRKRPIPGVRDVTDGMNRYPNIIAETADTGAAAAAAAAGAGAGAGAAGASKPVPPPRTKKPNEDKSTELNWTCDLCTLINSSTTNRCAACHTQRHESRVQPVTGSRDETRDAVVQRLPSSYVVSSACYLTLLAKADWTCSVCSASNRRESDVCHSCAAWICRHCTLHNHSELWICSICSRSRILL